MCRPPRLECKNPIRNAAVYHVKRLGLFRDWIVQNAVFRCSRYVALPAIISHVRGEGDRFVYSRYGDVGYSVSHVVRDVTFSANKQYGPFYYDEFDTEIKARNFVIAFPLSGVRFIRQAAPSSENKNSAG